MNTLLHNYLYRWPYSAPITGIAIALALGAVNFLSGAFAPINAPWHFSSGTAFIGMSLLITLIPAYISMCALYGYRRSFRLAEAIDSNYNTDLRQLVRSPPWGLLIAAGTLGILFAVVFNIPSKDFVFFIDTPTDRAIAAGQVLIWTILFCFISLRLRIARGFNLASRQVPVDIFEPGNLKPFAQIGLIDVLTIAGGLVLSTVQSLDFSFRPDNYDKALSIAIPAMVYLAIYPMWDLHKRMRLMKQNQLGELNALIASASKSLEIDRVTELEILLQRRERVTHCTTWPIDTAILQRFLFYIIIPPLAWVGAALVESVISDFIGGK